MTARDTDDFWDLTRLVPPKKRPTLESFIPRPATQDVTVEGEELNDAARHLHMARRTTRTQTYDLTDNFFLSRVKLETSREDLNIYHRFLDDARRYFTEAGDDVPYVRFFSYMPQYTQLTTAQLAYYLHWRARLLAGESLPCDEGYIFLYAYECINLIGSCLSPEAALTRLLALWNAYAVSYPKITKYLAEWVSDLCLIHRLQPPADAVATLLPVIVRQAAFPEFYFGSAGEVTLANTGLFLALLCDYDYRSSRCAKVADEEASRRFVETVEHSMFSVFHELLADGAQVLCDEETKTMSHLAFCGALYALDERTRLTITYTPVAAATELHAAITAAVKYSENLYRALNGIRNRLSVPSLDPVAKSALDAYYRTFFRDREARSRAAAEPAYMSLYRPAESGVAFARADEIEATSWETTYRLVPEEESVPMEPPPSESVQPAAEETAPVPDADAMTYLRCVVYGDQRRPAGNTDAWAERINQIFLADPMVGDIVLEPTDGGYALVEDYRNEVEAWIQSR